MPAVSWWQRPGRAQRRLGRHRAGQPRPRVGLPAVPARADGGPGRRSPRGIVDRWSIPAWTRGGAQRHRAGPQGGSGRAVRLARPRGRGRGRLARAGAAMAPPDEAGRPRAARRDRLPLAAAGRRRRPGARAPSSAASGRSSLRRRARRRDHGPGSGSRGLAGRSRTALLRAPGAGGRTAAPAAQAAGGGKSGLHGNTVPGNARRGRPQGKCHREQTARRGRLRPGLRVRVKGCGKSAPRRRQRRRHGKPHREQDQIGTTAPARERVAGRPFPGRSSGSVARGARRRASQRNGHPPASSRGQNPAYRPPVTAAR